MTPKYIGRDCELSTTGIDADEQPIDSAHVTRAVLRQVPAAFALRGGTAWTRGGRFHAASMDCLRNWASNGQCHYADMAHVECCTATCLDPLDFAAQCLCAVDVAEAARRLAVAAEDEEVVYSLSTANADMLDPSISFGTHISVSIEEDLWEDLFLSRRRPSRLAMVASSIAASISFFGSGYLLPLQDGIVYSLSARAHHLSRISTTSTTDAFHRGLLNRRREPHGENIDRLHLIGYDFCLASSPLLCTFLQTTLAAAEESYCALQLVDPVYAARAWSWGLDVDSGRMSQTARLVDGRRLTLPQYIRELSEVLLKMCESGFIPESVAPRGAEMLARIIDLTRYAEEGTLTECARHLTWASKLLCLLDVCGDGQAELGDATTRLLDHDFTNTDSERGPFWQLWTDGLVDPLVTREAVRAAWTEPPTNTRDYARGRIIDRFHTRVADVDWSYVELRDADAIDRWGPRDRIMLPRLDSLTKEEFDPLINAAATPEEFIRLLEASESSRGSDPVEEVTSHLALPGDGASWSGSILGA